MFYPYLHVNESKFVGYKSMTSSHNHLAFQFVSALRVKCSACLYNKYFVVISYFHYLHINPILSVSLSLSLSLSLSDRVVKTISVLTKPQMSVGYCLHQLLYLQILEIELMTFSQHMILILVLTSQQQHKVCS